MDFSFASLLSDPEERENSAEYHDHRASTKHVPHPPSSSLLSLRTDAQTGSSPPPLYFDGNRNSRFPENRKRKEEGGEGGQQYVEEGFSSGRWWKAERILNISPPHSSPPSRICPFFRPLWQISSVPQTDKRKEILDFSSNLSSCVPLRTKKQNQEANFNLPWMFSDVPFLHRDIQFCFPCRPKSHYYHYTQGLLRH